MGKTLYDKLWDVHFVAEQNGESLLFIDRHFLHEVTSPQAFEGLRLANRQLFSLYANVAVLDHNVPTTIDRQAIKDPLSRVQVETLMNNCQDFGIPLFTLDDIRQGIVHVIGPELGLTLPGMTIVCGDSHTSTHGALGTLSLGIGTSEVEHVLATQCLVTKKLKNLQIVINNQLSSGVSAKDLILYVISEIGSDGGTGCAIEFTGDAIKALDIEARMTICNMSIEAGARCGLVAVDEKTLSYIQNKAFSPTEATLEKAIKYWRTLCSDPDGQFDKVLQFDARHISPQVSWGTTPEMTAAVTGCIPDPKDISDPVKREHVQNALTYMGLKPKQAITDIYVDHVFIGSCTNSRLEDLRAAAKIVKGKKVADSIKQALVVPGSGLVKAEAEKEGLDKIFEAAGFEWRLPGCSMCLGMNPDRLNEKDRCASTSNRNFEGRQGKGARTHLVGAEMAAAAAIAGHFVDIRQW